VRFGGIEPRLHSSMARRRTKKDGNIKGPLTEKTFAESAARAAIVQSSDGS
jgi:hypothetical protein